MGTRAIKVVYSNYILWLYQKLAPNRYPAGNTFSLLHHERVFVITITLPRVLNIFCAGCCFFLIRYQGLGVLVRETVLNHPK